MPVSSVWTSPAAGGALDLSAGAVVTEANWDAMVSNFLWLAGTTGVTQANGTTTSATLETTTSNTGTVMGAPQVTLTTAGGDIFVMMSATLANNTLATLNYLYLFVDGSSVGNVGGFYQYVANAIVPISAQFRLAAPISSAAHTFALGWSCSSGTLTTNVQTLRCITVVELRR